MKKRFVSILFPQLATDWFSERQPALRDCPFVLCTASHGRLIITAANGIARREGISRGMAVADARAIVPKLEVLDEQPSLIDRLLRRIANFCLRFTPFVAIDPPSAIALDASGCAHLWGGEQQYLDEISKQFSAHGYTIRVAMADTIGMARAVASYGKPNTIIATGTQQRLMAQLPAAALRLGPQTTERLEKLGLRRLNEFMQMPASALRRRFGPEILLRLQQVAGTAPEILEPIEPPPTYSERLACPEPIITRKGIEIALHHVLELLCARLRKDGKGLRAAVFSGYRLDGKCTQLHISTAAPSHHETHIFYLFELQLSHFAPEPGVEVFELKAPTVEDHVATQTQFGEQTGGITNRALVELLDRISGRIGPQVIQRFLPEQHFWPERAIKPASAITEQPAISWQTRTPRPLQLLSKPESIEVTAPVPDYPPMLFRYKEKVHRIVKADGPERIEPEWWLADGEHRDYYSVEDENGCRYWLFRAGHYDAEKKYQWFLHGVFA